MAMGADLRAASDQSMRVDHGARAHPGPSVDEHGRHASDARTDITAVANAGAAGDDPHAVFEIELLDWKCGFVEPGLPRGVDRHIDGNAHPETDQNAFLYPGVDAPAD